MILAEIYRHGWSIGECAMDNNNQNQINIRKAFWDWWSNGGSQEWAKALDAEKGTLGALEMVFTRGIQAASEKQNTINTVLC